MADRIVKKVVEPLKPIALPRPVSGRTRTLARALRLRRTTREISDKKLPLRVLSNLLWSAYGINRHIGPFGIPGRTAASASDSQEIDLFVALSEGVFLYDAFNHGLDPVASGDLRAMAIGPGQKEFAAHAPVHLIYAVDIDRLVNTVGYKDPGLKDTEIQKSYYYVDTGLIAGNVYIFAAFEGLACWFHNCDRRGLAAKLKLGPKRRVLFSQTVGYPLKK